MTARRGVLPRVRSAVLPLAALLSAERATAQYLNRAVWLGNEAEGVRRDYRQDVDYFTNRWATVDMPPWTHGDRLDPFARRLTAAGGSVSSSRLTIESVANVPVPLDDGFAARLLYLQSENQTTAFQRIAMGLEAALDDRVTAFVQLEGTADKSRADFGFGAQIDTDGWGSHRATVTVVDFAAAKSDDFEYETRPFAVLLAGCAGDPDALDVAYEIGTQLPFEERRLADDQTFAMHRTIARGEARLRLGTQDRLVLQSECEFTRKKVRPADPASADREDHDIELEQVTLEWWRELGSGHQLALGTRWLHLRTDDTRPNDPGTNVAERRTEAMLSARAALPLSERWVFEPYAMAGNVDREVRNGAAGPPSETFDGFQGRLGVPLRYSFSDRASLRVDVGFELDRAAFAGGSVQFLARF